MEVLYLFIGLLIIAVVVLAVLLTRPKSDPSSAVAEVQLKNLSDGVERITAKLSQLDATGKQLESQDKLTRELGRLLTEVYKSQGEGSKDTSKIRQDLEGAVSEIKKLKTEYDTRKNLEDESNRMIKSIESTLQGSASKGAAGENILREIFKQFPPEMIEYDMRIGGKVVEFALRLPDGKKLAIDSKWPSSQQLKELATEKDEEKRLKLINLIEKETLKKVKEVKQYIDPAVTFSLAIAAVPDAVYSVIKKANFEAYRHNVMVLPYSMTVPYLLTFYKMQQQMSSRIDTEKFFTFLSELEINLGDMNTLLENSIERGSKMITNAAGDYRTIIGKIRGSAQTLQGGGTLELEGEGSPHLTEGEDA